MLKRKIWEILRKMIICSFWKSQRKYYELDQDQKRGGAPWGVTLGSSMRNILVFDEDSRFIDNESTDLHAII